MISIGSILTDDKKYLSGDTIQRSLNLINNSPTKIFHISNNQLESIKRAKQQISDGEIIDNNEVIAEIDQWIAEM